MHLFIAVLLCVVHHVTVGHARCCLPLQFEAERYFVELNEVITFAADFTVDRILESADPYSDVFDIWDLEKNIIYHWNGTFCSFEHSKIPRHFPRCLTDGLHKFSLGKEEEPIKAYGFDIAEDDSHSFFVVTGKFPECVPLFSKTRIHHFLYTCVYTNLRLGVSHQKIYTASDGCVEEEGHASWSRWSDVTLWSDEAQWPENGKWSDEAQWPENGRWSDEAQWPENGRWSHEAPMTHEAQWSHEAPMTHEAQWTDEEPMTHE